MLTDEEIKFHIDRNEDLKAIRLLYEPLWEEIAEYQFTRRIGIGYKPTPGQKQTTKQYDSTAEHCINLLAASMHGTLTPSPSIWSSFKFRDDRLNRMKEVMDWLEACANIMSVARHQSNFNSEIHEGYLDLVGFGQCCIFVEEKRIFYPGFNGLQYKSLSNSEYCTSENAEGRVDILYREFELSARAAIREWGEKNLGEKITSKADKKPYDKFKFIHCVYPKEMEFQIMDGTKQFVSYYIGVDDKNVVSEAGYYEFPFIVPRWSKRSDEDYGRGRGHTASPDVKSLNKLKELGLKSLAKDVDPATFEKDGGVIGSLKLFPGGRNVARDKESIWTLDRKARHDLTQLNVADLRQSIKEIFSCDQLSLPEKSDMREMEVAVRYELMQRILGPTLGRFEGEGLNPLIKREFGIMMRATSGKYPVLPPPPPILARMGVRDIDIEYEGPLAKSQRQAEVVRMQKVFTAVGQVQPIYEDIFDNFDGDEAARHIAEVEGMPSKTMRSVEERDAIREQRKKDQAAEQKKQDLERLAAGIKDVAPAGKMLMDQMGGGGGEKTAQG
jgi:hypothetical protein